MEKARIEVEVEDRDLQVIEAPDISLDAVLARVKAIAGHDELHVFERDKDEPVGNEIENRKSISVIAHRCRQVMVTVQFEHNEKTEKFPPSATVFRVLQWGVGKKGFNLDDTQKAKANLMLPGAQEALPKDAVIGRLTHHDTCALTLVLTLKDFTNG